MKLKKLLKHYVPECTPVTLHLVNGNNTEDTLTCHAFAVELNFPDWLKFRVLQISIKHDALDIIVTKTKKEESNDGAVEDAPL